MPQDTNPARAPSFEELLIQLVDTVADGASEEAGPITPKEKLRFRQVEEHPERISGEEIQRISALLAARFEASSRFALGAVAAEVLASEVEEFLARYEALRQQLTVGTATVSQIRWSLAVRFFAPWAALRIAFWLHFHPPPHGKRSDRWFVPPVVGEKPGSCFMGVVDREIRKPGETDQQLAERCHFDSPEYDQVDLGIGLAGNFSKYRRLENCASNAVVERLLKVGPRRPGLRARIYLARGIDRIVLAAHGAFGWKSTVKLVSCFELSVRHFRRLLQKLRRELPEDPASAWIYLQSEQITGGTRFESERFWPLTERFMHRLARIISDELGTADRKGGFSKVPTPRAKVRSTLPVIVEPRRRFLELERCLQTGDFAGAVAASSRRFVPGAERPREVLRQAQFFAQMGLRAFRPGAMVGILNPDKPNAETVLREAARLFALAYAEAEGAESTRTGIEWVRFLLDLSRPKEPTDRAMVEMLLPEAEGYLQKKGLPGSTLYLKGCFLWLGLKKKCAIQAFESAVKLGREACGKDWIRLLRESRFLAHQEDFRRPKNLLEKIAILEGVSTSKASPKTDLFRNLPFDPPKEIGETALAPFPTPAPGRKSARRKRRANPE